VILFLTLHQASGRCELVEEIVATVDGNPITLLDLRDFIRSTLNREIPTDGDESSDLFRDALDQLITDRILEAEVSQGGIKVDPEEVEAFIEKVKAQNRLSKDELGDVLKSQGLSLEKYKDQIKRELEKNELVNRKVRSRVTVSSSDVEGYYKSHQEEFKQDEEVRVRHILFALSADASASEVEAARKKAMQARERALSGEDFSALVQEFSSDPSQGGDLGFFARGKMETELEDAAFALSKGEVSLPIRLRTGFHLIKLEDRHPERVLPLTQVGAKIREKLYATALEERFKRLFSEDLKKKHLVEIRKYGKPLGSQQIPQSDSSFRQELVLGSVAEEGAKGFFHSVNPLSLFRSKAGKQRKQENEPKGSGGEPAWIPIRRISQSDPQRTEEPGTILVPPVLHQDQPQEHRGLPVVLEEEVDPKKPKRDSGIFRFFRSLSPF
jgi:peptidyl-prolyl cis-trans isomerase SurA